MPARKNLTGRPASSSAALSEMSNFLSRRAQQASQKKSSRKASAKKTLDAVLAALKPHLKAHRNSSSAVKASFAGVIKKFNSTRNGNTTAAARRKPALPPPAAARASRALLALARSASLCTLARSPKPAPSLQTSSRCSASASAPSMASRPTAPSPSIRSRSRLAPPESEAAIVPSFLRLARRAQVKTERNTYAAIGHQAASAVSARERISEDTVCRAHNSAQP